MEATGAQIVIKLLERQGIKTVAGIPGGSILPIYDALYKSSIQHILVRQEQSGGFIAQGIARSTGLPAVCLATSGPGAMNLLTAIADAKADSVPLIAITGQVATSFIGTDAFQEADTFGLSFPITKHSMLISSGEELLKAIPEAFSIASSGRPGPVLIDIPVNVQQEKVHFPAWPEPGKKTRQAARFRTQGKELVEKMDKFAQTLLEAENPVFFVGGGCTSTSARKSLIELLDIFPAPVVTSLMGLCALSSESPCFYGMTGMYGKKEANEMLEEADVILAAGVRFDERAAGRRASSCKGKILHIDIDAAEIDKLVQSYSSAVTDTETALPVLAECIRSRMKKEGKKAPGSITVLEKKEELSEGARLIAALPQAAERAEFDKKQIVVVTDVGQHQMWTAQGYPFTETRQLLSSGSLGTMGFGLPAAIGAALASPGKRILCISGDGSIMMNLQELATLTELDLDVTVAVIDNQALGLVKQLQARGFKHRYSESAYKKPSDIASIAEAFGIPSRHLDGKALLSPQEASLRRESAKADSLPDRAKESTAEPKFAEHEDWEHFAFPKTGSGPRLIQIKVPSSWK
ncbi:MAG: acetolactate synthase large subunit [Treponemataceae bacterium]|nr:acetolactate synthase large subunit [Treponemataceae bacterium]